MKSFNRTDRLGQLIHRELAQIIQLKMRDPRVSFVNVNQVKVTRDLSLARVYVSTLGDKSENLDMAKVLNHAAGFLRSELAKIMKVRIMPELRFIFDDTALYGAHIDKILNELEVTIDPEQADND